MRKLKVYYTLFSMIGQHKERTLRAPPMVQSIMGFLGGLHMPHIYEATLAFFFSMIEF
jgi:hypothetical protein